MEAKTTRRYAEQRDELVLVYEEQKTGGATVTLRNGESAEVTSVEFNRHRDGFRAFSNACQELRDGLSANLIHRNLAW